MRSLMKCQRRQKLVLAYTQHNDKIVYVGRVDNRQRNLRENETGVRRPIKGGKTAVIATTEFGYY